jgi:hypothetical protein
MKLRQGHSQAQAEQIKSRGSRRMRSNMPIQPTRAIAQFCQRVAMGAFVGAVLQAMAVLGFVAAVAMVTLRVCGGYVAPNPWWSFGAVPVVAYAVWRLRRERIAPAIAAAHLDCRLELDGLLLTAHEEGALDPAWQDRLQRGLVRLPEVLPRPRWRRLLPMPLLAIVFAAGVAMLPAPLTIAPGKMPALQSDLEQLASLMRSLFERGTIPDEVKQELEQKLAELQRKAAAGEAPEWRDLDQLDQRLEREELLQAAREPGQAPGGAGASIEAENAASPTPGQLAAAAKALADAGLLDRLPQNLLESLQKAQRPDGSFDAGALPQDLKALKQLAEAMAGAAGKFGAGQLGAGVGGQQLADLKKVLEQFGSQAGQQPGDGAGQGNGQGNPGDGDQGGRGGVDRGPGHSALRMTEDAEGGANAALPLPPGRALPGDWVPLGSSKSEPQVQPERNGTAGASGAAGTAGASWQLDLAPRHRAVLRRFFGDTTGEPGKDKR